MLGAKGERHRSRRDELHPSAGKRLYALCAQVVSSGAGCRDHRHWGADMLGIGKAIIDNGFEGPIYTYYAAGSAAHRRFGESGKDKIRLNLSGQHHQTRLPRKSQRETYNAFLGNIRTATSTKARIFKHHRHAGPSHHARRAARQMLLPLLGKGWKAWNTTACGGGKKMFYASSGSPIHQDMHVGRPHKRNLDFDYDQCRDFGVVTIDASKWRRWKQPTTCAR